MKSSFITAFLAYSALALGGNTAIGADTGVITLSGSIGIVNEIVITQAETATNLNILDGEADALIATVEESSNSPTGYTIYMNSVNDSELVNSEDDADSATYTISYDGGAPVSLTTADTAMKTVGLLGGLTVDESEVLINVAAHTEAGSGTFTDLITVSIAAN